MGDEYMDRLDVLAVGEVNIDMIATGLKRMPVLGQEILCDDFSMQLGGSTAITAVAIARLGLKTGFIAKLGRDSFGSFLLEELKHNGLIVENIIFEDNIQTGVTISLSLNEDRAFVTHMGTIEALTIEDIDFDLLSNIKHLHVGAYFLQNGLRPGLPRLFMEAKARGITTSLDAGWDDSSEWNKNIISVLEYTDIFIPSKIEALNISKKETIEEAIEYLSNYSRIVAVKCGSEGSIGKWGNEIINRPAIRTEVRDTTGAGDSFNAGFIYGFLKGNNLHRCLDLGNACGSFSVGSIGGVSACASIEDVEKLLESIAY
jgi:sugar/nucleoside kinase (ribokinase family)